MILEAARDTAAIFELDALLSRAREDYIEQVLAGLVPNDGFWSARERAAVEELKRLYYNRKVREAVKPKGKDATEAVAGPSDAEQKMADPADAEADQADYDRHGQKMLERAIWLTHEIIKQIPCVGQEEYKGD